MDDPTPDPSPLTTGTCSCSTCEASADLYDAPGGLRYAAPGTTPEPEGPPEAPRAPVEAVPASGGPDLPPVAPDAPTPPLRTGTLADWFGGLAPVVADPPPEVPRCRRCRRPLADAESVRLGIGPECRRRLGLGTVAEVEAHAVEAIAAAEGAADRDWLIRAAEAVMEAGRLQWVPEGGFTADDVWTILGDDLPAERRALGGVMRGLAGQGRIEATGAFRTSRRKVNHGAPKRVWRRVPR